MLFQSSFFRLYGSVVVFKGMDTLRLLVQQVLRQAAQFIEVLCGVQDVSFHAAMMTDEDRNILITG